MNLNLKTVIKSDGRKEPFNIEKLMRMAKWADKSGANWSEVTLKASLRLQDECTTSEINKAIIKACDDIATTATMRLAGRIMVGEIYKEAYGGYKRIPTLKAHYDKMVAAGYWVEMDYSDKEFEMMEGALRHDRDRELVYSEIKQLNDKYLCRNRVKELTLESPQMMYMGMAMANMERMPRERRMKDVLNLYKYLSLRAINAPTPFLCFLRTPHRGYASCCVSTCNDTIKSISAQNTITHDMTAASAGIGAHMMTRSMGDGVRNGSIVHQGKFGYVRTLEATVLANLQNNRGGAATLHVNPHDPEVMSILKYRSVKTPIEQRIGEIQYSMGMLRLLGRKAAKGEDWMLVSYADAPDLIEACYSGDADAYEALYAAVEQDITIPRKYVKAYDLVLETVVQAVETGGWYEHRPQWMNLHTPFKDTIYSSNLCQEIALPTKGYNSVHDLNIFGETSGEIGLCNLAAIVGGRVRDEQLPELYYYTLLMVDNVISLMDYPFPNLAYTAQARRSVGIGYTNLAHYMAKSGVKYSTQEGRDFIHKLAETHSYLLHEASLKLAQEFGLPEYMTKERSKYPEGWLPIDTYCKEVDKVVTVDLQHDWEGLRKRIIETGGIRNSVLEAFMPNESSSIATFGTNSILPIRGLKVKKTNKNKVVKFLAPDYEELADAYELAYDIDPMRLIEVYAIFQKFCGQTISADLYYKIARNEKTGSLKVPAKLLVMHSLYMLKMGCKSRYYINTETPSGMESDQESGKADDFVEMGDTGPDCGGGACKL